MRAVSLLQVLNKFNRHVYRTQTDSLLAAVIDLALRTSPRWLDHAGRDNEPSTFDTLIRDGLSQDSLVRTVYEGVTNLVSESHLVGVLLAVAHDRLFDSRGERAGLPVRELAEVVRLEAEHLGLKLQTPPLASTAFIPGVASVWRAVGGELCKNLLRYGVMDGGTGHFDFSEGPPCHVTLFGDRPFLETLHPVKRFALTTASRREEEFARILAEIRTVDASKMPDWGIRGGYGLAMIDLICQFLGISFSCQLGPGDIHSAPLVSVFEWEVEVALQQ